MPQALFPEIYLSLLAISLLLFGLYRKERSLVAVHWVAILGLAVAGLLMADISGVERAFNGMFIADSFTQGMKTLVIAGATLVLLISLQPLSKVLDQRFEYALVVIFAVLGMCGMISAGDMLSLYMGLELQSLSLYVLAAFQRDDARSTEAGLKYFVLGALASGMMLFGISLLYGFSGQTSFEGIASMLTAQEGPSRGALIGMVLVLVGLCFKVSAVPFHMWTPDVYQGAPTPVTAFFAICPKIAALALFARVLAGPFAGLLPQWQPIVILIAALSMLLGGFAGLRQDNIKRLLAYSSIGHVGFVLMAMAAGTPTAASAIVLYLVIYMVMSVGVFGCIMLLARAGHPVEKIADFAGLSRNHPRIAFALAALMFSMAGIPPLAGFFAKMAVFLAAIESGLIMLAIIGALASVVAAYYYLKIVKVMYFDPFEAYPAAIAEEVPFAARATVFVAVAAVLAFCFYPTPVINLSKQVAASLHTPKPAVTAWLNP
ncbi:MAG: NADH-quinone oxidoreductase subunit NuoN [Alphaproteobacteria bacterium]|nr:NADH-quinone oxidoreductase subunit NuoN [Alphaproteobacteria bacterium]